MSIGRILIFAFILFVLNTVVTAFTTYYLGRPAYETFGQGGWFYYYGPNSLVSIILFALVAGWWRSAPYISALLSSFIASLIAMASGAILIGKVIYSPTWYIDIPISILIAFAGTFIGSHYYQRQRC